MTGLAKKGYHTSAMMMEIWSYPSLRTLAPATQGSPIAPTSAVSESELFAGVLEGPLSCCTQVRQPKDSQFANAPCAPTLSCLPPQKHRFLTWKENDSWVFKQHNIRACIHKNVDSPRVAIPSSPLQRCHAIAVLPMAARSRKTCSIDLAS